MGLGFRAQALFIFMDAATEIIKKSRVSIVDLFVDVTVNEQDRVDFSYSPHLLPHPNGISETKPYPLSGTWLGPRKGNVTITPNESYQDKKIGNNSPYGRTLILDNITVSTSLQYVQGSAITKLLHPTGIKTDESRRFGRASEPEYHNLLIVVENALRYPNINMVEGYLECWLIWKGIIKKPPIVIGERSIDDPIAFTFESLYGEDPDNPGCLRDEGTATGHIWYQDWFSDQLVNPDSLNFRL